MFSRADQRYLIDQHYLQEQYRDASNLNARINLHERFGTSTQIWMRWVFDQLKLQPGERVLELGCGPGRLWTENQQRIPHECAVTLTDMSPGMVAEAQQNVGNDARFRFEVVDAQAIPFADQSFDVVVANHMLYHVPDREKAYKGVRRVLRPGGRFYTATNDQKHLHELSALLDRFNPNPTPRSGHSFSLETGEAELARWFHQVTLHRFTSQLVVTEVEPLVAYLLSGPVKTFLKGETLAEFTEYVEQQIAAHGAIKLTPDPGLLAAMR